MNVQLPHIHSLALSNKEEVKEALIDALVHGEGSTPDDASTYSWYRAVAIVIRRKMAEYLIRTEKAIKEGKSKRMYYLSMEYLLGQSMYKRLTDLGLDELMRETLQDFGQDLDTLLKEEDKDAALGNGGLGRLAACFLDSIATHAYPGWGYGLRYDYGMFAQDIENGAQVERPETWLKYGNPWEFARPNHSHMIHFGGYVAGYQDASGYYPKWQPAQTVCATAWDMPITGFDTCSVANLRLWSATAPDEFNLQSFNEGNYVEAVANQVNAETLTKVLYPNDSTQEGQALRLKQEYFFVSSSVQDILIEHLNNYPSLDNLSEKVAIQLNDTHPALAVAELMYQLLDHHRYSWDKAWAITEQTIAYTNHTLLPEALETWSINLMEQYLPRHMQIIYEINHHFLEDLRHRYPERQDLLSKLSIIDDKAHRVRMAHLAIVGAHKVNGVAALHSELLKTTMFPEFHAFYPNKFVNQTNGITPRRWLYQSNRELANFITKHIGDVWIKDLSQLRALENFVDNQDFCQKFAQIKQERKEKLAELIKEKTGIVVSTNAIFDTQVKRIHEYKRQLLNILHVIARYNEIKDNPEQEITPRVVIFAGKAAPGYFMAKQIIALINDVADVINNDPIVGDKLKVVFLPNYNVSQAEIIIPGSDLSEQISTAGMEASGTGNMKFTLNGALTIGTLDGANVEIKEEVGDENIFIFGLNVQEVVAKKQAGYNPSEYYESNPQLRRVLDMIRDGYFCAKQPSKYHDIFNSLTIHGDNFLVLADYQAYVDCQKRVDQLYQQPQEWTRQAIYNVARVGKFSADRTIHGYCADIWNIKSLEQL